MILYHCYFKIC